MVGKMHRGLKSQICMKNIELIYLGYIDFCKAASAIRAEAEFASQWA